MITPGLIIGLLTLLISLMLVIRHDKRMANLIRNNNNNR